MKDDFIVCELMCFIICVECLAICMCPLLQLDSLYVLDICFVVLCDVVW